MTTMIQAPEEPSLHVGLVGVEVWNDAVEGIRDGVLPPADPDISVHWEAAGIIADGRLDELWGRAIDIAQTSRRTTMLLARMGDVVFQSTVLVSRDGRWATTHVARFTVARDEEGTEVVGTMHPMVEVAIAPTDRLWTLIRRTLPPLEELRHEPRATHLGDATRLTVDLGQLDPTSPEAGLPRLPDGIVDGSETRASVFTLTVVADGEQLTRSEKIWALGESLFLIDPDTASVWKVPPGDVGSTLVRSLQP